MIYYANPSTEAIRDEMSAGRLGCIITPIQHNTVFTDDGWDVIADNGCFSSKWTFESWRKWLVRISRSVRFVVCPDVYDPLGNPCHDATLERWESMSGIIKRHGFTPAFVCQIGASIENIPEDAEVLFLGGTTEWKLGPEAWNIAMNRGNRWVHMGRVNSKLRLDTARAMGCDSVDGTHLTFGPDKYLPDVKKWIAASHNEPMLWENNKNESN